MTEPNVNLKVGDRAPEFALPAYPGDSVGLLDFFGTRNVILAFYPKDDTPGCTREMCTFSEDLDQFSGADTEVLGISCDDAASHQRFAQKHSLRQTLLADKSGAVGRAYGAVRDGRALAERLLFVIDKQGVIRHIHTGMPSNAELLAVVDKLNR